LHEKTLQQVVGLVDSFWSQFFCSYLHLACMNCL
jgi:hypothetical protein